jgi:prepilin-type N-terminal cleavage/methylation domain-containing protein
MKLNKKGFTLVELLAVIVVLAIILVIAVPTITNQITTARQQSLESSARSIYKSLENTANMASLGLGTDLTASAAFAQTCPTTAWASTADATCNYTYTAGNLSSLQVRLTATGAGKFKGATAVTYTGN